MFYFVSTTTTGEGWHNYHHVFPWDYKTAELGNYRYNITTAFIDFFAKIGWAYDMKTVSKEMIDRRAARTGDGSRSSHESAVKHTEQDATETIAIYGWNDVDLDDNDKKCATILNRA